MIVGLLILSLMASPCAGEAVRAKVTVYRPWEGGVNCWQWIPLTDLNGDGRFSGWGEGNCLSRTKSGERWQDWIGRGLACPKPYPLWSQWKIGDETWVCIDRGGWIGCHDRGSEGYHCHLDLLAQGHPLAGRFARVTLCDVLDDRLGVTGDQNGIR